MTDTGQIFAGAVGQGLHQLGKDPLEYDAGQVLGHLLLVPPPLG